jgi:hypothetical protein
MDNIFTNTSTVYPDIHYSKKMQIDGEHSSKLLLHDQSQTSLQYILALDVWKSAIAGSIFFYAF